MDPAEDRCPQCQDPAGECCCGYGYCEECGEEWDADSQGYDNCPSCDGTWTHWTEDSQIFAAGQED